MDSNTLQQIQNQIGYNFKRRELLEQAFTRRSFSQEKGGENNEILEFIGDKVLDLVVVKLLSDRYSHINEEGEYHSEKSEQELTELKKILVQKKTLSERIYYLDLEEYLIMGQGDIKRKVQHQESVKEDLFEAILGAVAVDSDWDMAVLEDTVTQMLNPTECLEQGKDYVSLIQDWTLDEYGVVPWFYVEKRSYTSSWVTGPFPGLQPNYSLGRDYSELQFCAQLKLGDFEHIFRAWGKSKSDARKNVCQFAYEHIEREGLLFSIKDEIEEPSRELAINQLEILARRGYFSIPQYEFTETNDTDGNAVWTCCCSIEEKNWRVCKKSSSKKAAKKDAAYEMLTYVLEVQDPKKVYC